MLTDLIKAEQTIPGPPCKVQVIAEQMSKEDAKEFREALADPAFQSSAITRALKKLGYEIGSTSIQRHRKHDCNCEKRA